MGMLWNQPISGRLFLLHSVRGKEGKSTYWPHFKALIQVQRHFSGLLYRFDNVMVF